MEYTYEDMKNVNCIKYFPKFLPKEISENAYKKIKKEVTFLSDEKSAITLMGKKINIPRKQCSYGDEGTTYRFTGISVEGVSWEKVPTLKAIKEHIINELKVPVNFVLVNYYKDGNDYIGYHSDNEKDIDQRYGIVSVSFGAARPFFLKNKVTGTVYEQMLHDNSCIIMNPPCQKIYKHSVPKRKRITEGRINLTFRVVKKPVE